MIEEYTKAKQDEAKYYKKHRNSLIKGGISLGLLAIFGSFGFPIGVLFNGLVGAGVAEVVASNIAFFTQIGLVVASAAGLVKNTISSYINKNKMIEAENKQDSIVATLLTELEKAKGNGNAKEKVKTEENEKVKDKQLDLEDKNEIKNEKEVKKEVPEELNVAKMSDEALLEMINNTNRKDHLLRLQTLFQTLNAIDKNNAFTEEQKTEQKANIRMRIMDILEGKEDVKAKVKSKGVKKN